MLAVSLAVLLTTTDFERHFLETKSGYTQESRSVLGDYFEYRRFSQAEGDLWVERADCRAGWLADWICGDFRGLRGGRGSGSPGVPLARRGHPPGGGAGL